MANYPRYAIYYAAAPGSELDGFGSRLLGYDAWTGTDVPVADGITQMVPDWCDLTLASRQYGFHATLKAPMSLADGKSEVDVLTACALFAETPRLIPSVTPAINSISGFIAVVPAEQCDALTQFAANCVRSFDCFRAPLTPEDRERRDPSSLTQRQREYLDRWGYPYVMEEFRFHMTLTDKLDGGRREPILTMLRDRFTSLGLGILEIDRIALFRQNDCYSRFRIVDHWKLRRETS
jgi:putative phosphonate metabolism protein